MSGRANGDAGRSGRTVPKFAGLLFWGLALVVSSGCSKSSAPTSNPKPSCESDAQCLNGYHCAKGVCEADCSSDAACLNGYTCSDGVCIVKTSCDSEAQCLNGYTCLDKRCTPIVTGSAGASSTSLFSSSSGGAGHSVVTGAGGSPGSGVGATQGFTTTTSSVGAGGSSTIVSVPAGGAASTQTQLPFAGATSLPSQTGSATLITASERALIDASRCNVSTVQPDLASAKLALVIDIASSMNQTASGTGNMSKWEVLRDAMLDAINNPASLDARTSVGLLFYPNLVNESVSIKPEDTAACINVDAAIALQPMGTAHSTQRVTLASSFQNAQLGRGTPTADAYAWALEHLLLTNEQKALPGGAHVLLVTDGSPTLLLGCYNPAGSLYELPGDGVVQLVTEAAASQGVRTHVIGLPGSEGAREWLSRAAVAGGTASITCATDVAAERFCHLDLTTAADHEEGLRDAIASVLTDLSGCRFVIPDSAFVASNPNFNPILTFTAGEMLYLQRDTTASRGCLDGYRIVNGKELELCEQTCEKFRSDGYAKLQLVVGCSEAEFAAILR